MTQLLTLTVKRLTQGNSSDHLKQGKSVKTGEIDK